jgi:hypothetical protein
MNVLSQWNRRQLLLSALALFGFVFISTGAEPTETSDFGTFTDKSDTYSERARRIDISSSFSYYFNYDGSVVFDSTAAPATFIPTHLSNLSLSMGLKLYKDISAYIDLGIKDKSMKKAIDWASRVGSKYFDLQIEYNFIGGKMSYLENVNIEVDKNAPPKLNVDYDQTWVTVALLYPLPIYTDGPESSPFLIGLFYNSAKVPALFWVDRDKGDDNSRFAILDIECPVNIYGVRFYEDNIGLKRIPDDLPSGWTRKIPFRFTADIGFGFAKLNKDVIAEAIEKGGQFSDNKYPTSYLSGRFALSLEYFNRFTENQVVHFGFGFEVHGFGYLKPGSSWENGEKWSSIFVLGVGPIVRAGYAW